MTTRIDKVAVLGTGVLGLQIAFQTAYSGFDVTAYNISDEIPEKARNRFGGLAARYEQEVEGASDGSDTASPNPASASWSSGHQYLSGPTRLRGRT